MYPIVRLFLGIIANRAIGRLLALAGRLSAGIESRRVTRRAFLRNTVLGSVVVVLAEVVGGFFYFFWPNKTGAFGREIIVPASQIPAVGAAPYVNQAGKFYIINNDEGLLALYWKCPHLGCTVPWNESQNLWVCPCHGSVYNRFGERIAGPAPRPMDLMALTFDATGNAVVDTGNITLRAAFEPEQAVQPPG